jgi:hypothetical protein
MSTTTTEFRQVDIPILGSRMIRARLFLGLDGSPETLELLIGHVDPWRPDARLELPGEALAGLRTALAALAVSAADR